MDVSLFRMNVSYSLSPIDASPRDGSNIYGCLDAEPCAGAPAHGDLEMVDYCTLGWDSLPAAANSCLGWRERLAGP